MVFWQRHPALLYGLFFYLGVQLALMPSWYCIVPLLSLIVPLSFSKDLVRLLFALFIGMGAYFYAHSSIIFPDENHQYLRGKARIEVDDITHKLRFGAPFWKYRLTISSLIDPYHNVVIQNIPCIMNWKDFGKRPTAGGIYEVEGSLKRGKNGHYTFAPSRGAVFHEIGTTFSFVEFRLQAKTAFKTFVRKHLPPSEARGFLEGLVCGEFPDALLAQELRRFGLSHIMVVSGFHFSLLVAVMGFLLKTTVSRKWADGTLFLLATIYLLFVGFSPSVLRAWCSVGLFLLAAFAERKPSGLNSLGVSLMLVLVYDPTLSTSLSFQLSFLATGAILLFYSQCDEFFDRLFPSRSPSFIQSIPAVDQLIYFLMIFFRKAWSLTCAVNILMLPVGLYYFKSISLLGILHNFFFPALVAICMGLFVCACFLSFLPIISDWIFSSVYFLTDFSLTFVKYVPESFDKLLTVENIPPGLLIFYLTTACCVGLFLKSRFDNEILI